MLVLFVSLMDDKTTPKTKKKNNWQKKSEERKKKMLEENLKLAIKFPSFICQSGEKVGGFKYTCISL